jgi:hypothetical protein
MILLIGVAAWCDACLRVAASAKAGAPPGCRQSPSIAQNPAAGSNKASIPCRITPSIFRVFVTTILSFAVF